MEFLLSPRKANRQGNLGPPRVWECLLRLGPPQAVNRAREGERLWSVTNRFWPRHASPQSTQLLNPQTLRICQSSCLTVESNEPRFVPGERPSAATT